MKILIISYYFPPQNTIGSLRPYSWAKFWTEANHDVTVLTPEKYQHPETALDLKNNGFEIIEIPFSMVLNKMFKRYSSFSNPKIPSESSNIFVSIIKKIRDKTGIFHGGRMPDLSDLWIRPAWKKIRDTSDWDLVISTSGPYSVHILGSRMKQKGLAKYWIADYRDLWVDNPVQQGMFPFKYIEAFLERRLLKNADAITTISKKYSKPLVKRYGSKKVHAIENGFDTDDYNDLELQAVFPQDQKTRLLYTGTVNLSKQNIVPLFEAVRALKGKKYPYLENLEILFFTPTKNEISALAKKYSVESYIKTSEFVSRKEVLKMQKEAHFLLFCPWNDLRAEGVLSGKIFEYLFSQTPILAIGSQNMESSQELILETKAGYILPAAKDIELFLNEKLRNTRRESNHIDEAVLERFHRRTLAMRMLQLLPKI